MSIHTYSVHVYNIHVYNIHVHVHTIVQQCFIFHVLISVVL